MSYPDELKNKRQESSVQRILNAFTYSMNGLHTCYKTEQAFRQEIFLCVILAPIPFFCEISNTDRALMVFSLFVVLITELVNSAIEALADQVSTNHYELIKKAKDTASAAVFLSLIAAAIVWGIVLFA